MCGFDPTSKTINKEYHVTLHIQVAPLISLIAGIGILVFPKLLNYIVAVYLIVLGILGMLGHGF
jgi:uncharacterized membrane protein YdbT with pleckstrin-like domain